MHHFKSDLINKMDHMRISGTEIKKLKSDASKVPKQAKAKGDYGVIITEHDSLHKKKRFDWTLRGHDP